VFIGQGFSLAVQYMLLETGLDIKKRLTIEKAMDKVASMQSKYKAIREKVDLIGWGFESGDHEREIDLEDESQGTIKGMNISILKL